VAALPDGRVVSGGGDRRAVVWDVTTRKEIAQISCPVYELAIGPLRTGESTLVIAYEKFGFSLWQSSMNHRTNCLCIQPDGSWVIRAEWGRILGVFPAHSGGSGCRLRTAGASAGDPSRSHSARHRRRRYPRLVG
jgi:WD40 repeat protein